MRVDIMMDLETLGTNFDSTIVQISAVSFDIYTGNTLSVFNLSADISKNENYEMRVTGDTLKFWLNNGEVLNRIFSEGNISSSELLREFHEWLKSWTNIGDVHLWGNGILFDNTIVRSQMELNGLDYPIHYRNDRDLRTVVDMACEKSCLSIDELREAYHDPNRDVHYALDDCHNQIDMLIGCRKILINGVMPDEGYFKLKEEL